MSEQTFLQKIGHEFKTNKLVKYATIGVAAVGGIALLWWLYAVLIGAPANEKASDAAVLGQNLMQQDSTAMAITELERVVKKYDGAKSINSTKVRLSRLYMDRGDHKKAFNLLEDTDLDDTYGPAIIAGLKGDCKSEMKSYKEALSFYEEAANASENEHTTPFYLFKAGLHAEEVKDFEKAGELYKRIRDNFSSFASQKVIEKYIARVTTEIED